MGVQYLRGLAAVMVLVGHVIAEAEHYLDVDLPLDAVPWTRGVDLFFVISGFIIMVSAQKYLGLGNGAALFLGNRIRRVVPLYWLFTTLMVLVLVLMPGAAKDTQLDWGQVVSSYLFLPYERYDGRTAPVLSLGWTLNFEMFFYVLFAASVWVFRRRGPVVLVAGLCVWAGIGALAGFDATVLRVWSNPLILEFAAGVLLGHVYLFHPAWRLRRNGLAIAGLVTGFAALVALDQIDGLPRFVASGGPALVMVAAMVLLWQQDTAAGPASRLGAVLGDSSYALYLSHRFVLRSLTLVLVPVLPGGVAGAWVFVALACTGALGAGIVVFRTIERPFLAGAALRRGYA